MKYTKIILLLFLALLLSRSSPAQESKLSIEDAIKIALEKNYDVQFYSNLTEIGKNNNTAGNAGMLPSIDLNGTYVKSSNDLKQQYSNGTAVDRNGSGSAVSNIDAGLSWTVFDGLKMFHTKKKLDGLFYQSELQLKLQMETTVSGVVDAYYSIIRYDQLLKSTLQEILLLNERLNLADRKLKNGSGSKLDLLQAQIELNRQKSIQLSTESSINESKVLLNQLLARQLETPVMTDDTVIISYRPTYDELKKSIANNNTFLLYEMNLKLSELSLKENQSLRYPKISLTSHYIFNKNTNDAGFSLLNQSQGINYGVTASFPVFHGWNINRQIKNSKIDVLNAKLKSAQVNESMNADLMNTFRNFSNSLLILQTEEDNILLARQVLEIAQERYKIGASNFLELQDSFRSFEESMSRLTDARFNSKQLETSLKRISGQLIMINR